MKTLSKPAKKSYNSTYSPPPTYCPPPPGGDEVCEITLNESLSEFQENDDFNLKVKEEEVISMTNVLTQQPVMCGYRCT
jgi:hypothetical protein